MAPDAAVRCDCARWASAERGDCPCPYEAAWITACEHLLCGYCLRSDGPGRWQCDGCGQIVEAAHFRPLGVQQ